LLRKGRRNPPEWLLAGTGKRHAFAFSRNPARISDLPFVLFFLQEMTIVEQSEYPGEWKLTTLKHTSAIEDVATRREVIAFHWRSEGPVPYRTFTTVLSNRNFRSPEKPRSCWKVNHRGRNLFS
jgi:hypothetical protein